MARVRLEPGRIIVFHLSGTELTGRPGIKHALRFCCTSTTGVMEVEQRGYVATTAVRDAEVHVATLRAAGDRPAVVVQAGNDELAQVARVYTFDPPAAADPNAPNTPWGDILRRLGYTADKPMTSRWMTTPGAIGGLPLVGRTLATWGIGSS